MSPTPVTMASPVVGYTWEATDEQVAERFGIPIGQVARFDLNTAPVPSPAADRVLDAHRFVRPVSEYPPSDYRDLVTAAAETYRVAPEEILVGAGADEILDLCAKAFLPPGGAALVPVPSYAMYAILTKQRGARVVAVPRLAARDGYALDVAAVRAATADGGIDVVWLCDPNNPTGLSEPDGTITALLGAIRDDASVAGRLPPVVVLDEAYAEFVARPAVTLDEAYPRLVVVRTASKAYALAGLRVGFAIARRETLAAIEPYRPPGSVSVLSVSIVTDALRDSEAVMANVAALAAERERLAAGLRSAGWSVGPSVTNFLLVNLGSRERAADVADGLMRRGLVPRTFGPTHPLADHLRITVRSASDDDRLIAAARAIAAAATTTVSDPAAARDTATVSDIAAVSDTTPASDDPVAATGVEGGEP